MAGRDDKKLTKKPEAKKTSSAADMLKDLRGLTTAELNKALIDTKAELARAKKMLKANELPSSHVIRQMQIKIARIHSVMTENKNNKEAK